MTNNMIIFNERIDLMEKGVIGTTGRKITVEVNGEKKEFLEPEEIHTYAGWKERGFQVKRGEKNIAQFTIWKHVSKKDKETDEENSKMFMKKASWFKMSQVEEIA